MCALQTTGDQPLAEREEANATGVLFGKFGEGGAARVAPLFRPLAPVEGFTLGGARFLYGFEAAVVFQCLTGRVAETAEIGMQRVFALDEALIQGLQQTMLGFGGHGPVNQRLFFQMLQFGSEAGGVYRGTPRALAENSARRGVEAVEKQPAGR